MAKLQQLDRTILDREEAKEVAKVNNAEEVQAKLAGKMTYFRMSIHLYRLKSFSHAAQRSGTTPQCVINFQHQPAIVILWFPAGVRYNNCKPSRIRKPED